MVMNDTIARDSTSHPSAGVRADVDDADTDDRQLTDSEDDGRFPADVTLQPRPDREANKAILEALLSAPLSATDGPEVPSRLEKQESDRIIDKARDYQQELFERAKDENCIAVLDTGSGKTLIAALLIRHFLHQELIDRSDGQPPRIIFFLVNSVHLARQQARFLNTNLPDNVIPLFGSSSDDLWRQAEWTRIFATNSVVVCTAAVLDQCLFHSYLDMGKISLMVFDEAHHCKKGHPYSKIIRDYYIRWPGTKPRIFGMTASPVDSKKDIQNVIDDLESMLQSKIVTTTDQSVFAFAPRATDEIWTYPPLPPAYETDLYVQLEPLCGFIEDLKKVFEFSKVASSQLGHWAADRMWRYVLPTAEPGAALVRNKLERSAQYVDHPDCRESLIASLREASSLVHTHDCGSPLLADPQDTSPKLAYLYDQLKARFAACPGTRAIVFVQQRLMALALCDFFDSLPVPHVRPGVLIGVGQSGIDVGSWKDQEGAMERFRAGLINVIFATSVAEEGIDIPQCNLVVRFDLCQTPIQYMQSRGRARMKDSVFAHLLEEGNKMDEASIHYAIDQADYIRGVCQSLPPTRLLGQGTKLKQFMARDASCQSFMTGSKVLANYSNALLLLSRYADSLKRVGAESAEIFEEIIDVQSNTFRYKVILPTVTDPRAAQVRGAKGDARSNKVLAKRSAAWHCCFKLRKAGLLDENLDSIFVKVKPENLNARITLPDRKDDYDKQVKPGFWMASGVGSTDLPTVLHATQVLVGRAARAKHACSVLLLTRSCLPEIPSFPIFVDNNQEQEVCLERFFQPIPVTPEDLDALTDFTLNAVFHDVFNKIYAKDSSLMSYWLAPPGPMRSATTFEDLVDGPELRRGGLPDRKRWKWNADLKAPSDEVDQWCNAFLVDPGSGQYHYFTAGVVAQKSIWDPPPDTAGAVPKKHMDTIIGYTDSRWRKKGQLAAADAGRYDPYQPVLEAVVVKAGRNFSQRCPAEQRQSAHCHIAPQPLEIARISASLAQVCQFWPCIFHRLEAYLIAREAFDKLDLAPVPLDLALEAFTRATEAPQAGGQGEGTDEDEDVDRYHPGSTLRTLSPNYERLEFLGDALLKLMTTITIFNRTTCDEEGMHCKRMELTSNRRLCRIASDPRYQLFRYVRSGSMENWRDTWYPEFLQQQKGRIIKLTKKHRTHALGMKTIADVCEATIGACIMTTSTLPTESKLDLGIRAITKLVDDENHNIMSWKEVAPMYTAPPWSLIPNDPIANDLARRVREITGYQFKNPRLLRSAFTHSSDQNSTVPDFQRLEFLGDACLDWVSIWWLFSTNPSRGPQWLTEHKMAMVSNRFLAALAVRLKFNRLIFATTAALYDEIGSYAAQVDAAYSQNDRKPDFWTQVSPGSTVPKALADIVESYLGAVLVDSGFDFGKIENFFEAHVKDFFQDIEAYDTFANRHPTTHLTQLLHHTFRCRKSATEVVERISTSTPAAATYSETGKGADRDAEADAGEAVTGVTAHVAWFVHNKLCGQICQGRNVKYAKVRASRSALKAVGQLKIDEFRSQWGCDCPLKASQKQEIETAVKE